MRISIFRGNPETKTAPVFIHKFSVGGLSQDQNKGAPEPKLPGILRVNLKPFGEQGSPFRGCGSKNSKPFSSDFAVAVG